MSPSFEESVGFASHLLKGTQVPETEDVIYMALLLSMLVASSLPYL